jgi:rare lipoprotein A
MTRWTVSGAVVGGLAIVAFAALVLLFSSPVHAAQQMCGTASFYGYESGTHTATGERFNPNALTAAMPSRSHLGERWRVSAGGRSVVVRINDLGPAKRLHRVVDLSKAAFARLAPLKRGTLRICMEKIG